MPIALISSPLSDFLSSWNTLVSLQYRKPLKSPLNESILTVVYTIIV